VLPAAPCAVQLPRPDLPISVLTRMDGARLTITDEMQGVQVDKHSFVAIVAAGDGRHFQPEALAEALVPGGEARSMALLDSGS
jgi:hypothetical protein